MTLSRSPRVRAYRQALWPLWVSLGLALASVNGCGGKAGLDETSTGGGGSGGADGGADSGRGGGTGRDASVGMAEGGVAGRAGGEPLFGCVPPDAPPASPLLALDRRSYVNTIAQLFFGNGVQVDESDVPGAYQNSDLSGVGGDDVRDYHRLAHQVAQQIAADPKLVISVAGCDPAQAGEATCRRTFIENFVRRGFRRPASPDDVTDFEAVFTTGQTGGQPFASGVRAVVEVVLQSPEFLYRIEFGEPAPDHPSNWARPTAFEMASRLSFLIWRSSPDDGLLDAAAQGKLVTKDDVATQARRLLADDRSRVAVQDFYFQLLDLHPQEAVREPEYFPTFTPAVGNEMERETRAFIDDVTWNEPGDFASVFTSPTSWMNQDLATFYGIKGVTGDTFRRVALDPTRRAGILTQGSFLVSTSNQRNPSPVARGSRIAQKLLCTLIPPEPPDITPALEDPPPNSTQREIFEAYLNRSVCAACHNLMDPIGFGFGNYDAVGLWQDTDHGKRIDTTGELHQSDVAGKFDDAIELSKLIANSQDAKDCFVDNWMLFAYRDIEGTPDDCAQKALRLAFTQSNFKVRDMLVALTQVDPFLYRRAGVAK